MNPKNFKIIDGKLYLSWSSKGAEHFASDPAANISKANKSWEEHTSK